ncbi:MAG: phosphoglucomutase [Jatrophihabitantaceae bacterium]
MLTLKSSADGWRGEIGASFTPAAAGLLAAAVLDALAAGDPLRRILISYDGRRDGAAVAAAVRAAVSDRLGIAGRLYRGVPTPVASAAVSAGEFDLAFLVTASHNPAGWNGLKIKYGVAGSISPTVERRIESRYLALAASPSPVAGSEPAAAASPQPMIEAHLARVLARVGHSPGQPWRVVIDGLHGIAGPAMVRLAELLGWTAHPIGCDPDPDFGGLAPDPTVSASRRRLSAAVRAERADFGIALDGDGDRVVLLDSDGALVGCGEVYALLLDQLYRGYPELPSRRIAVTSTTTSQPGRVAAEHGGEVLVTGVGFKNMAELLAGGQICAAGGNVGDLAFAPFGFDRDPSVVVALLSRLLADSGQSLDAALARLRARFGRRHYLETSVSCPPGELDLPATAGALLANTGLGLRIASMNRVDGVRLALPEQQWLSVRRSSTENLVRAYAEFSEPVLSEAELRAALQDALRRPAGG